MKKKFDLSSKNSTDDIPIIMTKIILVTIVVIVLSTAFNIFLESVDDHSFIEKNNGYCEGIYDEQYTLRPVNENDITSTTIGYVCCRQNKYLNEEGELVKDRECRNETWIPKEE